MTILMRRTGAGRVPSVASGAFTFVAMIVILVAAGCGGKPQLMPTPNVYAGGGSAPFADVPPALQSNTVEVLYLTDRAPEEGSTPQQPNYGHKRSRSVAFGVCEVRFGEDVSWEELVEASTHKKRSVKLAVEMTKATELCRFPPTPKVLFELPDAKGTAQPSTLRTEVDADVELFRRELTARLAKSDVKDVYIFVHGVKTGFSGSVTTIAELWHFLGREGVPVAYSWPAGGRGLLRGYNYDYNSSEFTVYHLKETLRGIAAIPEVRKVHIIAHSRGTDVVVSAVRELHLEISGGAIGTGATATREALKLGTVVLAAPDLDVDVTIQRTATARLGLVPERSVIYICEKDEALGLSRFLFGSMRLGKLRPDVFTPEELSAMRESKRVAIIDARLEKPGSFGHNYFYSNPAVSSDLILLLRHQLAPGAEHGRPLHASENGFWYMDDKYPGPTTRPASDVPDVAGGASVSSRK
jgi:esterase/lipase superfamily enzyme